jgi:LytS/YehU family sensor histidine kinase
LSGGQYQFDYACREGHSEWIAGTPLVISVPTPLTKNPLIIGLAIVAVLVIVFGVIRIASVVTKKRMQHRADIEKRIIQAELTALKSQMNPHFIFNSLNSVYNFILENNTEHAAEYLSKFAILMRMVLSQSQARVISLESELRMLGLYLELEHIRYDEKFTFQIKSDLISTPAEIHIPPMLIQPYVENAIWHGFMHKQEQGHLTIEIVQIDESRLRINIEDNGIGRDKARQFRSNGRASYGSSITSDRLASFSILYDAPFEVKTEDLVAPDGTPCGTRVTLELQVMKSMQV